MRKRWAAQKRVQCLPYHWSSILVVVHKKIKRDQSNTRSRNNTLTYLVETL